MNTLSPTLDVRAGSNPHYPAGPQFLKRILRGEAFRVGTADFMLQNAQRYGDLVHYRAFNRSVYQVNHPDLIADFFLKDSPNHHRSMVMQSARQVLGHGLLTSEEPLHMRQRRLGSTGVSARAHRRVR